MTKPFSFSYSRMKNFETCPKRHYHVDIVKDFKEAEGEALLWGNAVHKALADRVAKGTALPEGMASYERWVTPLVTGEGKVVVEQRLAINKDFGPAPWFGNEAWLRIVADAVKIAGPVALMIDWKTGKVLEEPQQLALAAAVLFAHYPELQAVRTEFIWLKEGCSTREDFRRDDMPAMWRNVWPRIEALKQAHETTSYPPKPGRLCKRWCPVASCPHHGE